MTSDRWSTLHDYDRFVIWRAYCCSTNPLVLHQFFKAMAGEVDGMNEMYKAKLAEIQDRKGSDSRTKTSAIELLK